MTIVRTNELGTDRHGVSVRALAWWWAWRGGVGVEVKAWRCLAWGMVEEGGGPYIV